MRFITRYGQSQNGKDGPTKQRFCTIVRVATLLTASFLHDGVSKSWTEFDLSLLTDIERSLNISTVDIERSRKDGSPSGVESRLVLCLPEDLFNGVDVPLQNQDASRPLCGLRCRSFFDFDCLTLPLSRIRRFSSSGESKDARPVATRSSNWQSRAAWTRVDSAGTRGSRMALWE